MESVHQPESRQNSSYIDKLTDVIDFTTGFGPALEEWTMGRGYCLLHLLSQYTLGFSVLSVKKHYRLKDHSLAFAKF